jgi:hypothetical protein
MRPPTDHFVVLLKRQRGKCLDSNTRFLSVSTRMMMKGRTEEKINSRPLRSYSMLIGNPTERLEISDIKWFAVKPEGSRVCQLLIVRKWCARCALRLKPKTSPIKIQSCSVRQEQVMVNSIETITSKVLQLRGSHHAKQSKFQRLKEHVADELQRL